MTRPEEVARGRVRVILDCEWDDLQHALDLLIDAKPLFDGRPSRPGWGWGFGPSERRFFVRETKQGFSVRRVLEEDR